MYLPALFADLLFSLLKVVIKKNTERIKSAKFSTKTDVMKRKHKRTCNMFYDKTSILVVVVVK